MTMTPQKKAAKTRKKNRDSKLLYLEYTKPAHDKVKAVLNKLLLAHDIRVRFVGNWRLKSGVTTGRLLAIDFGGLDFIAHVDGYKSPRNYSSRFWELN